MTTAARMVGINSREALTIVQLRPMCSEKIENARLRLATLDPRLFQKVGSSGAQSSIHRPLRLWVPGGGSSSPDGER